MPGLALGVGANVRGTTSLGSNPPTTATQAAYGTAATPVAASANLAPTNPAGLAFWLGVGGLAFLVVVYYSLPG